MKKKYYFILSAIIQIVESIHAIFISDKLVASMLAAMDTYPDIMKERITNLFENSGSIYIISLAIICIILNTIILVISIKGNLVRKKGAILACSIISFFTANAAIIEILAIINIVVIATTKRVNSEDFPNKEEKKIPAIKKEKVDTKEIALAFLLLIVYFSQEIWGIFLNGNTLSLIVTISFYILMIGLSIFIFYDTLKLHFIQFKKNLGAYIHYILPKMGIYYLIYIFIAYICMFIANQATSNNQSLIENMPIFISFPLAVIYAPIVEEILFRGCIRRFINNDKVFIIISGIIFGLLHTIFSETSIFNIIIVAIPYAFMGCFLAYIYTKTNNLLSNISCHALNNLVAILITILIKGF